MTKVAFFKRAEKFLLIIMIFVSLFLFCLPLSGCGMDLDTGEEDPDMQGGMDDDPTNKPAIFLVYRPYANTIEAGQTKSYAERAYDNLLDLSEKTLTEVVGCYGFGDVAVLSLDPENPLRVLSPNMDNADFKKLFGLDDEPSQEEKIQIITKLNNLTSIYVDSTTKIMVLSNNGYGASDLLENRTDPANGFYAKKDLVAVSSNATDVATDDMIAENLNNLNKVYFYENGTEIAYVFLGGKVGSVPYLGAVNDFTNTRSFLTQLYNFDYAKIEKLFVGVPEIMENTVKDLSFDSWKSKIDSGVVTADEYLASYVSANKQMFAVYLSASMLTNGTFDLPESVDLPIDYIPTAFDKVGTQNSCNLKLLFENATKTGATDDDQQKFLQIASLFLDHFGVTELDKTNIISAISKGLIGDLVYSEDIYLDNITLVSNQIFNENSATPILNYYDSRIEGKHPLLLEDVSVDGYIQSIIIMTQGSTQPSYIVLETNEAPANPDYVLKIRCNYGMPIVASGYYSSASDDIKETVDFSVASTTDENGNETEGILEEGRKYELFASEEDITIDVSQDFAFSQTEFEKDTDEYYYAWYFNKNMRFLELAFASPTIYSLQYFDISMFSLLYEEE